MPTAAKLQLFKAAILPYLTYCHLTWYFCRASDTRKLERVQEKGLRTVFRVSKSTYKQLLKRGKLPSLHDRRLQDIGCPMFKVKHSLCPQSVRDLFLVKSSTYGLRNADFHLPRFYTVTYGKHSLRYLGPKLWNKLPANIRNLTSLSNFKGKIRHIELSTLVEQGCTNCVLCTT